MAEYKKEAPKYHSWVDKDVTLENWLANIITLSHNLKACPKEILVSEPGFSSVMDSIIMSARQAWDLVPEEKDTTKKVCVYCHLPRGCECITWK